jgi:alkylation response protein AidB-like acyl-CoA dehydrogenase
MNFAPTELQSQIADMIKDFADKNIRPKMMEWDETQEFPVEVFKKLGDLGLMGILIPTEYGGSGMTYMEYITAVSEIAKVCGSIGLSVAAHNSLCTNHIYKFASDELKKKYIPKLATGEWIGAWGLTEANTGSDAGNMQCVAKKDGDDWVISGTKNWITHGKTGDVAVVLCRTGEPRAKNNVTAFAIEKGTPGFTAGKKENKLGMRASETTELVFDNCRISDAQRLGNIGEGFKQAMIILDGGRISIAALALGIAKGAYEASIKYSKERFQFDQPISNFQAIQWKLADMATQIEGAELLIYQAADKLMRGEKMTKESAMAKYYASEVSVRVATEAVQIFGGYGYTKDFPVEKYYRDSKLCTIGEGTSEIQKLVISRDILTQ